MGKAMNFFAKRIWAGMLVVVLLAIAALGCSDQSATDKEEGAATTEPVEVSILMPGGFNLKDDSPIYQELQIKLNIKLKISTSAWDDYDQNLNIMMASGELPDVFFNYSVGMFMGEYLGVYKKWIQEGMLLPMSDYTDKYPNLEKRLSVFEGEKKASGGKHYSLYLQNSYNETSNGRAWFIRQDWLDKLGLKMPQTTDEFYEVARAFTKDDPDGNGQADTYGLGAAQDLQDLYPLMNSFNASLMRARSINGVWTPEVVSDEMKNALRYVKKLYDEKIMDSEFMLIKQEQKMERFVTGKVGIIHTGTGYTGMMDNFKKAYPDKDPKSMFTFIPTLIKGPDGTERIDGNPNWWGAYSINAQSGEAKQQKALVLLDFLLSDEGVKLFTKGVEGVHYKVEGGQEISLLPEGKKLGDVDTATSLIGISTSILPTSQEDEAYKADLAAGFDSYGKPGPDPLRFLDLSTDALDLYKQLFDFTGQALTKLVIESQNYDEEWNTYKETWMSMAGSKFIERLDAEAKQAGL